MNVVKSSQLPRRLTNQCSLMATAILLPSVPFKTINPISSKFSIFASSNTAKSNSAKQELFSLIADQDRGLKRQESPLTRASIVKAIEAMASLGRHSVTTGDSLSATWRMLWTTEKEQLFVIEKAYLFGTSTGDELGFSLFIKILYFFVRSGIEIASPQ